MYPGVERVVTQIVLLASTLTALLVGVILNLDAALLVALGIGATTVLLGIAVDVLDAARLERRAPTEALFQQMGRR